VVAVTECCGCQSCTGCYTRSNALTLFRFAFHIFYYEFFAELHQYALHSRTETTCINRCGCIFSFPLRRPEHQSL
jgi:hypothetical protein